MNTPPVRVNEVEQGEISLIDIIRFLKSSWKVIALAVALGLAAAVAYLVITPQQYEATAQISMAQINTANNNLNPLGINIEEPAQVIARFSSPTSFTPQAIEACGFPNEANANLALSKMIKWVIPKGVTNVVELKVVGSSLQVAQVCAANLFSLIKDTQAHIVTPYIDEAKARIAEYEDRLNTAKNLLSKADKSGQALSANYLSTRDEIHFLLDEIATLKGIVSANQNRATRLVAPIYANQIPIAPKKNVVLVNGVLSGLFLGLLFLLVRQLYAKLSSEMAVSL